MDKKMKSQTHLTKRGAIYRFRCRVPADLVELYGKREITHSLQTKDKKVATEKACLASLSILQEFTHKRSLRDAEPVLELTQLEIDRLAALWGAEVMISDEESRINQDFIIDAETHTEGIDVGLDMFSEALYEVDYSVVASFLPNFLEDKGIKLKTNSESYKKLAYSVLKEGVRVYAQLLLRERGEPIDSPKAD